MPKLWCARWLVVITSAGERSAANGQQAGPAKRDEPRESGRGERVRERAVSEQLRPTIWHWTGLLKVAGSRRVLAFGG